MSEENFMFRNNILPIFRFTPCEGFGLNQQNVMNIPSHLFDAIEFEIRQRKIVFNLVL